MNSDKPILVPMPDPKSGRDWLSASELRGILSLIRANPHQWVYNAETKYLDIRLDCRDCGCLIKTGGDPKKVNDPVKFWRLNPELRDYIPVTSDEAARLFSEGKISADEFGRLLGLKEDAELHRFNLACKNTPVIPAGE